jgi:hypothetical protein
MHGRVALAVAAVALALTIPLGPTSAQQPGGPGGQFVPGELIVKYRPGVGADRRNAILATVGASLARRFRAVESDHVRLPGNQNVTAAMAMLRAIPDVELVQPNFIRQAIASEPPNDQWWLFGFMWGLERIQVQDAWTTFTTGNPSVVIANIDTGVDYTHPDLAPNMWVNPGEIAGNGVDDDNNGYVDDVHGIDAFNDDSDPMDDHGHGTHTAGTAGARGNNGFGIPGVAWETGILACKFLDAQGNGADADAIECFDYLIALKQGGVNIRVSSNSWGAPREDTPAVVLKNAIDAAGAAGILNVFAAGNAGTNNDVAPVDPASFDSPSIVAVAASDESDVRAGFSNYGATSVDLAAPGDMILSTYQGGYAFASGTSMAAPHVAGAVALLASSNPALTVAQMKGVLLESVDVLPLWTGQVASGGRLNVYAALIAGGGNKPPTVTVTSPAGGSAFDRGSTVAIAASATDTDGTIAQVNFYANGAFIASDLTGPNTFSVSWTPTVAGQYALTAVAFDDDGASRTSAPVNVYIAPPSGRQNVALAAYGAVATASSTFSGSYPVSSVNNGDRLGIGWANGGGWNDATANAWPDWVEVAFNGPQTIEQVSVFTLQDDYNNPSPPALGMTFTGYGVVDFAVQYWTGSAWQQVPGGAVTGNNLVWREVHFTPITTSRVRVFVTNGLASHSRIVEIEAFAALNTFNEPPAVALTSPAGPTEVPRGTPVSLGATASDADGTVTQVAFYANGTLVGTDAAAPYSATWTPEVAGSYALTAVATDDDGATGTSAPVAVTVLAPAGRVNVALASSGGIASASSTAGAGYPPSAVNNGDRLGLNWANGGGWNDGTNGAWPDWVEVAFNGPQTIEQVDVFTLQDNYSNPSPPTSGMTFTQYGIVDFSVEYWTGTAWQVVPGGTVTGNNLVWRQINFLPLTTSRIRVLVAGAVDGYSRVTEVEAYAVAGVVNAAPSVALTSPADGTTIPRGGSVDLSATASDTDGTVTQVRFFANGTLVGSDTTGPPYTATWTPALAGVYELTAVATDDDNASTTSADAMLTVTPPAGRVNVALASNGGIASASSSIGGNYPVSAVNNGDTRGLNWGSGGGWNDGTAGAWPDWVEVAFSGPRTIEQIDVFTLQDDVANPATPTPGLTFSRFGIVDFRMEYWTGSSWQTVPGSIVTDNNLVWRQVHFLPVTTSRIRVLIEDALDSYSRVVEVEAYAVLGTVSQPPAVALTSPASGASVLRGTAVSLLATATDADGVVTRVDFFANGVGIGSDTSGPSPFSATWTPTVAGEYVLTAVATDDDGSTGTSAPVNLTVTAPANRVNVALASNGGVATASSTFNNKYPVAAIINGDRLGLNWGNGGGWNDKTKNNWPDWVEITFAGQRTIEEVDVFTVQDSYNNPSPPTTSMTFSRYGVVDFAIQYWTGSAWQTVPGGTITGNNRVWRQVSFTPVTTSRIRIHITNALDSYSRLTEVEVYTAP